MNLLHCTPNRRVRRSAGRDNGLFTDFLSDYMTPFLHNRRNDPAIQNRSLKVDIYEKEDTVHIEAELPGIDKEDISVDVKGKMITLGGERRYDKEIKEENSYRRERSYGKFQRTFQLPFEVESENVRANYTNGILKLEIPRPEEQTPKKIAVN